MGYGSNLNNTQGSFNGIFKTASASVGTTKAETDDFKLDVVSVFRKNKSNTAPLLKYPYDIDNSRIKENKTLKLFILKDAAYQKIVAAAADGADKFLKSSAAGIEAGIGEIKESIKTSNSSGEAALGVINGLLTAGTAPVGATVDAINETAKKFSGATKLDTKSISSEYYHCIITLPIPNNLTEDETHSYEDGNGLTEEIKKQLPSGFTNKVGMIYNGGDALIQNAAQVAQGADRRRSQQISQLPILNPYTWKKFKGSALKVFKFTFFFVPRSKKEAEEIMKIVYTLKKYSYGSKKPNQITKDMTGALGLNKRGEETVEVASDFFISAPPKVLLEFNNNMLQKLINPGVCVIDSIGLTYNEGNTVGMTLDGVPRFIEMNLSLSEYNVRFQEDF